MPGALVFFVLAFATIVTLVWAGAQLLQTQEDPLSDRLADLRNAGLVAAGGNERIRGRGFAGRFVNGINAIPGGEDWVRGSQKRLRQAGYRSEEALGNYCLMAVAFFLLCCGGMLFLQRHNDGSSMFGGMIAAGIIGFMLPQFVLGKLATRYRKRLQDALPDTI
ncbi:MAG TPA: hypothetical protein VFC21_03460, partial [Bryobacteraceae bacterium]|nr:hypothetical protein [Bryobacteraceae bacterium]